MGGGRRKREVERTRPRPRGREGGEDERAVKRGEYVRKRERRRKGLCERELKERKIDKREIRRERGGEMNIGVN